MNYIPGFSNHLETALPRYAGGGAVTSNATTTGAVPAAAPYDLSTFDPNAFTGLDLSGLDSLYGLNFASNFGGGASGGIYKDDPNLQYINAPISNKGNPTSPSGNVFTMTPDQKVRLVDLNTNTIVFEGTGYDAAREATRLGQSMTDSLGRKASYNIQTADPTGKYTTVANEKYNKSTLGTIADVAGTALPIAVSLIPGLQFAGPVLSAVLAGGAGAALKGDNILKGAAMGGLSAAGGQVLGQALGAGGALGTNLAPRLATAVGTGLGSTAGGLVTGNSLKNSLLGGVASGALSYVAPDIQRELGISPKSGSIFRGGDTSASTGGGTDSGAVYGGPNAEIVVNAPAFSTPNINLGGYQTPAQNYVRDAALDNISNPLTNAPYSSGYDGNTINVTGSVPGAVTGGLNLAGPTTNPVANNTNQITDEIVVTGTRPGAVTGGLPVTTGGSPSTEGIAPEDLITVTGTRPGAVTGGLPVTTGGTPTTTVSPDTIVVTGNGRTEPTAPVSVTTGGTPTTTVPSDTIVVTGNGRTDPPVTGGLTLSDATLKDIDTKSAEEKAKEEEAKKKLGLEEYLRLLLLGVGAVGGGKGGGSSGTYVPGGRGLDPIFSANLPTANIPGGVGAASNLGARQMGDVDWLTYGTRPELSFFDYVPMAKGGMFAAKRGGQSRRTEFAVNGAGTGRSDDIPAVLSDGEYVMDAETVALLGDGSSKAGAKKLDDLRVKVRKHKGKKLAKGRFSANAKRPEAYLSGGRI